MQAAPTNISPTARLLHHRLNLTPLSRSLPRTALVSSPSLTTKRASVLRKPNPRSPTPDLTNVASDGEDAKPASSSRPFIRRLLGSKKEKDARVVMANKFDKAVGGRPNEGKQKIRGGGELPLLAPFPLIGLPGTGFNRNDYEILSDDEVEIHPVNTTSVGDKKRKRRVSSLSFFNISAKRRQTERGNDNIAAEKAGFEGIKAKRGPMTKKMLDKIRSIKAKTDEKWKECKGGVRRMLGEFEVDVKLTVEDGEDKGGEQIEVGHRGGKVAGEGGVNSNIKEKPAKEEVDSDDEVVFQKEVMLVHDDDEGEEGKVEDEGPDEDGFY